MKWIFGRAKPTSCKYAKNRLSDVIKSDRAVINCGKTVEKLRRDVADVLKKYMNECSTEPDIRITCLHDSLCVISAKIPIDAKENNLK